MLDEFLARFYQTISFGPGEPFPAEGFRARFRPDALLLERTESEYTAKTVEEHIREFETAVRDYPQLFVEGFAERQTSFHESCLKQDTICVSAGKVGFQVEIKPADLIALVGGATADVTVEG